MPVPNWGRLEDGFKQAIGGLPNYKRAAAWQYVYALQKEIERRDFEITELGEKLGQIAR